MRICIKCVREYSDDYTFCGYCHEDLTTTIELGGFIKTIIWI